MSIQKPYSLVPSNGLTLDGNEPIAFSWTNSGDIQYSFKLYVYDNDTGTLVYSVPKTTTFTTKFTLPPSTLTNGKEYKWNVTVYNQTDQSATSDFALFQTSSRPVVTITSFGTIGAISYTFNASYSQTESSAIRTWIAYLYNENKNLLSDSGLQTTSTLSYQVTNLESGMDYYIEFQATSNKNLTGTTGLIPVSVQYQKQNLDLNLTARNVENAGIELSWFVVSIVGRIEGTGIFVDSEKLDVTDGKCIFDEGVSISSDFTLKMWIENVKPRIDLLELNSSSGVIRIQYDPVEQRFIVYKKIDGVSIISKWQSNIVNSGRYYLCIQQINNSMNVYAEEWV